MKLISETKEYQYDSREEMEAHIKKMKEDGYYCKTSFDTPFIFASYELLEVE